MHRHDSPVAECGRLLMHQLDGALIETAEDLDLPKLDERRQLLEFRPADVYVTLEGSGRDA